MNIVSRCEFLPPFYGGIITEHTGKKNVLVLILCAFFAKRVLAGLFFVLTMGIATSRNSQEQRDLFDSGCSVGWPRALC